MLIRKTQHGSTVSHSHFKLSFHSIAMIIMICGITLLSACSKEGRLDQQLLSNTVNQNPVSYIEKGDLIVLNGINYTRTSSFIGIPVQLAVKSKVADIIVATIDPSLISAYNTQHGEHNLVFPDSAFALSNKGIFPVSAGEAQSKDSLFVILKNGTNLKGQTVYLIPVKIASKNNNKVINEVIYFKMMLSSGNLTAWMESGSNGNGSNASRLNGGALSLLFFDYYPDSLRFNVSLSKALPGHDVIVESTLLSETQMDSVINAQYLYAVPLPSSCSRLTKRLTTIPQDQLSGNDSLTVSLTNKDKLEKYQYYIMGVKLKQYTESKFGAPPMPGDSSVAYVRFFLN